MLSLTEGAKQASIIRLRPGGSVNRLGGPSASGLAILGVGREEQRPLGCVVFKGELYIDQVTY